MHNDLNRLSSASVTAGQGSGMTLNWTYDRYGNRWSQTLTGLNFPPPQDDTIKGLVETDLRPISDAARSRF